MASNDVNVKVNVDSKGMGQLEKDTQKAKKANDDLAKSGDNYQKQQKGVAGATSNSTKAFSKMTTGIDSGLVPAYATLAANVFAVTAAFGVLQRAAQVDQLTQGLRELGRTSGLAMTSLSKGMIEASGAALSMEEAMRSVISITSAGLDPSKVQELTVAARNASTALGRDMQDSIQRLTRGITKLEPELLDELGIFVRLDTASADYARSVGKTTAQLTNFEKRQAFANAVLDEAQAKFGAIGNEVDSNPYNRLAATFADLSKNALSLVNTVLKPLVSFLASSPTALIGVMAVFASSIVSKIVPGIEMTAQAAKKSAEAYAKSAKDASRKVSASYKKAEQETIAGFQKINNANAKLKSGGIAPKTVAKFAAEYKNADDKAKFLKTTIRELKKSEQFRLNGAKELTNEKKKELAVTQQLLATAQSLQEKESGRGSKSSTERKAIGSSRTSKLTAGGLQKMAETTDDLAGAWDKVKVAAGYSSAQFRQIGKQAGIGSKIAVGLRAAAGAATLFGSALLNAIPIIGQIIFVVTLVWQASKALYEGFKSAGTKELEKNIEALSEVHKELADNLKEVDKAFAGTSTKIFTLGASYTALDNILAQFQGSYDTLNVAGANNGDVLDAQEKAIRDLIGSSSVLTQAYKANAKELVDNAKNQTEAVSLLNEFIKGQKEAANTVTVFKEAAKASRKSVDEYMNSLKPKSPISEMASGLKQVGEASKAMSAKLGESATIVLESLSAMQAAILGVSEKQIEVELNKKAAQDLEKEANAILAPLQNQGFRLFSFSSTIDEENAQRAKAQELLDKAAALKKKNLAIEKEAKDVIDKNIDGVTTVLTASAKTLETNKGVLAVAKEQLATEKAKGGLSTRTLKNVLKLTNDVIKAQKAGVQATIDADQKILESMDEHKNGVTDINKQSAEYINLTNKIRANKNKLNTLDEQAIDKAENLVEVTKGELAIVQFIQQIEKASLAMKEKQLQLAEKATARGVEAYRIQLKLKKASEPGSTSRDLGPKEEYLIVKKTQELEAKNRDAQLEVLKTKVKIEYDLIDAQYALLSAQLDMQIKKANEAGDVDLATKLTASQSNITSAQVGSGSNRKDALKDIDDQAEHQKSVNADVLADAAAKAIEFGKTATGSFYERLQAATGDGGLFSIDEASTRDKIAAMGNMLQPLGEELRKLGPEGELIAGLQEGMFKITDSVMHFGEVSTSVLKSFNERTKSNFTSMSEAFSSMNLAEQAEVVGAALQVVGASVSALASAMSAASRSAIAGIDKQIEREKALDGKSAESVAKLKSLEAKKEAMKRKAFEQDKKMKMAQAIIGTATGITQALSSAPAPYNMILAGLVGAMGMAQVSLISGMTYNGGSASADTSAPTSVSAGKRGSSIDMASSRSAAGELGYMRGNQGIGGANNFTPAFTGAKYRAAGGNTAFVVGEQGPEMFVPDRPGTIVPADETAAGLQPTVNANINISAVDAQGVEEVLLNQRGNIIGMLREAANSNGETFLESVNTLEA